MNDHCRVILFARWSKTLHDQSDIRNVLDLVDMMNIGFDVTDLLVFIGVQSSEDTDQLDGLLPESPTWFGLDYIDQDIKKVRIFAVGFNDIA